MLTENTILIGNKVDMTTHFLDMTEYTRSIMPEENILYSVKGIQSQLDKISYSMNGIGMVFVIIRDESEETGEISLSVKSYYIHIKEI